MKTARQTISPPNKYPPGSLMAKVRKRRVIETLAAFIGGGWFIYEIVHWILVDHYHLPERLKDIALVSVLCALLCALIWRWFRGEEKKRKVKFEFVLVPIFILMTTLVNVNLLIHLKGHAEGHGRENGSETEWENSIAVLPFADLSPEKNQEYFCDGIAEALLNALTNIEDLRVAARTSAFSFKDKGQDIREIGKKLNVKTILEGSVRKADERLRISVQLISIVDGFQLWSKQYDRKMDDVFAIQDEIAQNIVQSLNIELSDKEKYMLEKSGTEDVQAYDFYIRGRMHSHLGHHRSYKYAIELFSQAIKKDPGYAHAYTGLADSYAQLFMYFDRNEENLDHAIAASQKALDLDPELAEAHVSRALAISQNLEYEEAEKEFETAIRLNPKLFDAYYLYGRTLRVQGKHKQAARLFEQATRVRPEDYEVTNFLVSAYEDLGLEKKAKMANQRAVEIFKKHLELNPDDSRALYLGAFQLLKSKDEKTALEWVIRAIFLDPEEPGVLYNAACFYSLLGMSEEALDYFEKAIDSGYSSKEWIENDSDLDLIRDHPRFQAIMGKLK